jgi:virginiamycin B lyase
MVRRASRIDARYVGSGSPSLVEGVAGARVLRSTLVHRAALALVALAVATLALAARADAFVYWTNSGSNFTGPIGRANLDGTGVNRSFIRADNAQGVAVDGAHIYWANLDTYNGSSIGRANLDGTGVNQSFIGFPVNSPQLMAVDSAHVYWADSFLNNNNQNTGVISRANLDGSGAIQSFIVVSGAVPDGVAVDAAHIYWTSGNAIGRANLDGTGVNQSFITGANGPWGVAVDGAHIYWVNTASGTIGRANLDGTGANQNFIAGNPANVPEGVAVDGAHIYWANTEGGGGGGTIGRANLDGTGVNQSFITGATYPVGVAVDASSVGAPPPAPHFLKVTPSPTNPGKTITVSGSVDHGCQTGHKGATATIYSNAFKGVTKQSFAGIPAVYVSLRKSKTGAFSFKLKLSKKLKTGTYPVGGRCGGGNFGSAKLKVVKAGLGQSPPPHTSLQILTNTYACNFGTCWGTVSGSGLKPESGWFILIFASGQQLTSGLTDATGSVSQKLVLPCGAGFSGLVAFSRTSAGASVESAEVSSPCG